MRERRKSKWALKNCMNGTGGRARGPRKEAAENPPDGLSLRQVTSQTAPAPLGGALPAHPHWLMIQLRLRIADGKAERAEESWDPLGHTVLVLIKGAKSYRERERERQKHTQMHHAKWRQSVAQNREKQRNCLSLISHGCG